MDRDLRLPPDQATFDQRVIPVRDTLTEKKRSWFRLHRVAYPNQFFPSKGSRLTPSSGNFSCVYLAASLETTVAEVWGDRLAALRDAGGSIYVITESQAKQWSYLKTPVLPLGMRLCDLTDRDTRLASGIESGTLYSTDLAVPQLWAERIARHPAHFDGILYRSRHTDELCLVLWIRPERKPPLEHLLRFESAGAFCDSEASHIIAGKIGVRLAFTR